MLPFSAIDETSTRTRATNGDADRTVAGADGGPSIPTLAPSQTLAMPQSRPVSEARGR